MLCVVCCYLECWRDATEKKRASSISFWTEQAFAAASQFLSFDFPVVVWQMEGKLFKGAPIMETFTHAPMPVITYRCSECLRRLIVILSTPVGSTHSRLASGMRLHV